MVYGKVHPYIPNSADHVKKEMLKEIGMESAETIYSAIPERLRFKGKMNLPAPILSEARLRRHVEGILKKNKNCKENINFLGGGCWQHYVPSVCDTIMARDEFLTSYVGEAYSDHGKFQALFEASSMIGDLTGFDACNTPTYDWANAVAIAGRMACRTKGRKQILISEAVPQERALIALNYWKPEIDVVKVKYDYQKGLVDLKDLESKVSARQRPSISRIPPTSASSKPRSRRSSTPSTRRADSSSLDAILSPLAFSRLRASTARTTPWASISPSGFTWASVATTAAG
jgi:glycine dehydrogenase subunit 1